MGNSAKAKQKRQQLITERDMMRGKAKRANAKVKRRNHKLRDIEAKHGKKVDTLRHKHNVAVSDLKFNLGGVITRARWIGFGIGVVVGGVVAGVAWYIVTQGGTV